MNEENKVILRDLQGFIEFCVREDMEFSYCLGNLGHDINGLIMDDRGFSPRSSGYAKELKK